MIIYSHTYTLKRTHTHNCNTNTTPIVLVICIFSKSPATPSELKFPQKEGFREWVSSMCDKLKFIKISIRNYGSYWFITIFALYHGHTRHTHTKFPTLSLSHTPPSLNTSLHEWDTIWIKINCMGHCGWPEWCGSWPDDHAMQCSFKMSDIKG